MNRALCDRKNFRSRLFLSRALESKDCKTHNHIYENWNFFHNSSFYVNKFLKIRTNEYDLLIEKSRIIIF